MSEHTAEKDAGPLTALAYVQMWLNMTEHQPGHGHYVESRACRRKRPSGLPKDSRYRCTRCDGEALMRVTPSGSGVDR